MPQHQPSSKNDFSVPADFAVPSRTHPCPLAILFGAGGSEPSDISRVGLARSRGSDGVLNLDRPRSLPRGGVR